MAVLAPIPSVRTISATAVNVFEDRSERMAALKSSCMVSKTDARLRGLVPVRSQERTHLL
jgi:hypothetical protein